MSLRIPTVCWVALSTWITRHWQQLSLVMCIMDEHKLPLFPQARNNLDCGAFFAYKSFLKWFCGAFDFNFLVFIYQFICGFSLKMFFFRPKSEKENAKATSKPRIQLILNCRALWTWKHDEMQSSTKSSKKKIAYSTLHLTKVWQDWSKVYSAAHIVNTNEKDQNFTQRSCLHALRLDKKEQYTASIRIFTI